VRSAASHSSNVRIGKRGGSSALALSMGKHASGCMAALNIAAVFGKLGLHMGFDGIRTDCVFGAVPTPTRELLDRQTPLMCA
jgi:hypothetical protein